MATSKARPGRERKVYLRKEVDDAFVAYLEDNGSPAVNAVLLDLVESFLMREGYLPASSIVSHRTYS